MRREPDYTECIAFEIPRTVTLKPHATTEKLRSAPLYDLDGSVSDRCNSTEVKIILPISLR